jgi:MFS family permease
VSAVVRGSFLIVIVLAKNQHASPTVIGILFGIASIGGLLGSLVCARIQTRFGYVQVIISCVWLQVLLWSLFAVAPNQVVLGLVSAGIAVAGPIYNVVQFSYRVALIPDALQGRVNSAVRMICYGFNPLGAAASGILIEALGVTTTVLILSGVMLVLAVSVVLNRHVREAGPITSVLPA